MANKPGMTLIEVLIAGLLVLLVGGVFADTFRDGWRAQISQEVTSELQRSTRMSADEVSRQIRAATTVVASVADPSSGAVYLSTGNSLVLRLPPLNSSGTILAGDDYLVFRRNPVNDKKIERLVIPNASSVRTGWKTPLTLGQDTSSLTFRYYSSSGTELTPGTNDLTTSRKVTVIPEARRATVGGTITRSSEVTVFLRNRAP